MNNIISTISNNPLISTIVGSLFSSIIILIISIFISRKKKILSYRIIYNNLLITNSENIKIFYSDKEINNIYIVIIEIDNACNSEIKPEDYDKNISIVFDESINILSAIIKEKYPDDLDINLKMKDNKVLLDKILLNKNDRFIIQFELTSKSNFIKEKLDKIQVSARIAGFKIKKRKHISSFSYLLNIFYAMTNSLIIFCLGITLYYEKRFYLLYYICFIISFIAITIAISICISYIYTKNRSKY